LAGVVEVIDEVILQCSLGASFWMEFSVESMLKSDVAFNEEYWKGGYKT
jgi:hypothetical protein